LNFPLFIADRLRKNQILNFSATVYRIGVGSIAIGLAVMIVAFAVFFGFKSVVKQKIFSLSGQIQIKKFTRNESFEETPLLLSSALYKIGNSSKSLYIKNIQAVSHKTCILQTNDDLLGVLLKGVGKDYNWANFDLNMIQGQTLNFADSAITNQILISNIIAQKLQLRVGQTVRASFLQNPPRHRKFVVQGIYETGIEEIDNQLIIGDIRLIQKLNNWGADTVGTYEIFVKDYAQIDAATAEISRLMTNDMSLELVSARFQGLFDWLQLLDRNVIIFLALILFVATFNMVSILLVMMMERTPMIGLLKALGSNNWTIRQIFVYQGVGIIIKGLFWGNVIGIGIGFLQQTTHLIGLDPINYYMSYVPIEWHWDVVLYLNLATLCVVSLVLIIPTFIITQIQPIKAITFNK
jgi:lipoprotein-releasing system permease protein